MSKKTAREKIERAFHVSFKLPEQVDELLYDFENELRVKIISNLNREIDAWEVWGGRDTEFARGFRAAVHLVKD